MISHIKFSFLIGFCFLAIAITAGCSAKHSTANWQHPTLAKELWSEEIGYCRRHARRETDIEAGFIDTGPSSSNLPGGLGQHRTSMSQFQLQRFQQRTFDSCMKRRGFLPIVK